MRCDALKNPSKSIGNLRNKSNKFSGYVKTKMHLSRYDKKPLRPLWVCLWHFFIWRYLKLDLFLRLFLRLNLQVVNDFGVISQNLFLTLRSKNEDKYYLGLFPRFIWMLFQVPVLCPCKHKPKRKKVALTIKKQAVWSIRL